MTPLLSAENINFSYPESEGRKFSLTNISFEILPGDFISIIGRNGSGKSTLIKLLSRIYLNYSGGIKYRGNEIHNIERKEYSRNISYLPQTTLLLNEELTVNEFLLLGRYSYKSFNDFTFNDTDKKIVDESMEITGSAKHADKKFSGLSGGEKQKILLTLSLVQLNITEDLSGKILLVDEPITYLDVNHQYEIFNLLKKLNEEKNLTVVIVIHDLNLAMKYSLQTILLENGKIIFFDKTPEVITSEILKRHFLIDSRITNTAEEQFINFIY